MNMKYLISIGLFVFLIALSAVSASDSIDVTTGDTFYFYSTDSLAASDGYYAAVVVDGTPYYLDYDNYDKLCEYSTSFAAGFLKQFKDTSSSQKVKVGGISVASIETPGNPVGDFEKSVDKKFSFDYTLSPVGLNKQAHVITSLDLNDD